MKRQTAKRIGAYPGLARAAMWCLCAAGLAAIGVGVWRLRAPVNQDGLMKSAAMASLVDSGQSLCDDLGRVVQPAIRRTQMLAKDPQIIGSILSGDKTRQTAVCNAAVTGSTEIDAVALFDAVGGITAINTVYASGKPIDRARVDRILNMNFGQRDVIQKCVRNGSDRQVLEFQTTCDITPAFFDSTGLSVAYSAPVFDPQTGKKIGVVSSRLRFERLTDLIRNRAIGGARGSTQFVTDNGGYFSEEINSGKQRPPVPTTVLAGVVLPLVQGSSDYCFTQQGKDYLCLFKLREFSTLAGGGIQVMVVADEAWLMGEVRQARILNCGVLISVGLFLILCAVYLRSITSLRQSEKWNRLLIDSALDSVITTDENGIVRGWNPQAYGTFGYTSKEACGRRLADLILPGRSNGGSLSAATPAVTGTPVSGTPETGMPEIATPAPATTAPDLAATAAASAGKRAEIRAVRKDGAAITIEVVVTPGEVGHAKWNCVFARDVTEQRLTEMHLAQSQKLESIGQMAAGIAHEINTPTQYVGDNTRFVRDSFVRLLAYIDRQHGLLRTGAEPMPWPQRWAEMERLGAELDLDFLREEIPKALDQSTDGLRTIAKIVGAMKEFAHPGGQSKRPADLNAAIKSTSIVCRNRWAAVAELDLRLDPDLPPVQVLPGEFNQVMLNLIVNAADAIAETAGAAPSPGGSSGSGAGAGVKGRIVVSTRSLGGRVEIRVQDNGPGISAAVARNIFEPFFTTKSVGKGTGQGLMLSRTIIVKKHGGDIRFEPAPGGGTVFVVLLPVGGSQSQIREAA